MNRRELLGACLVVPLAPGLLLSRKREVKRISGAELAANSERYEVVPFRGCKTSDHFDVVVADDTESPRRER